MFFNYGHRYPLQSLNTDKSKLGGWEMEEHSSGETRKPETMGHIQDFMPMENGVCRVYYEEIRLKKKRSLPDNLGPLKDFK